MIRKHQTIQFCKMHGLGNDFVVIDTTRQSVDLSKLPIRELAHRHLGIGFDQLLIIQPSKNADFFCRIFNADGGEAEQCGNGLRCVARFIHDEKMTQKSAFLIETKAGEFAASLSQNNLITISMGVPCLSADRVPVVEPTPPFPLTILSMGNPHAIMQVSSVTDFSVATIGEKIATHTAFPHGINVGFMEIVNRQQIILRTFERGAGETFACGSNACAAVVSGIMQNKLNHTVKVILTFGELEITWPGEGKPVLMTGPAVRVFDGVISG